MDGPATSSLLPTLIRHAVQIDVRSLLRDRYTSAPSLMLSPSALTTPDRIAGTLACSELCASTIKPCLGSLVVSLSARLAGSRCVLQSNDRIYPWFFSNDLDDISFRPGRREHDPDTLSARQSTSWIYARVCAGYSNDEILHLHVWGGGSHFVSSLGAWCLAITVRHTDLRVCHARQFWTHAAGPWLRMQ